MAASSLASAPVASASLDLPAATEVLNNVDADKIGLVQAADLLEDIFAKAGLLYTMDIHPRQASAMSFRRILVRA